MRIEELDLSRAAAVDETEEEEGEESVESEDEMELEPLPLPVAGRRRVYKCPTADDDFRCEGPWVRDGQFRFRFIYPKVPVEEYQESEGEMEPVPVDGHHERVQEPLPVPVDDQERVQERSSRRRQQQADAADGSCCKRPRRVQEPRNDARCKRPTELLPILFTKKEQEVKAAVLQMKFEICAGSLTHESLLKNLQELKLDYEKEFYTCDVAGTACQLAQALLRFWFVGWQEAMEQRKPDVYHSSISWFKTSQKANETREPTVYRETISSWKKLLLPDQKYKCPDATTCPYTELVTQVVLPVMRRYIINSCDPLHTPDFILSWEPLLPQVVFEALLMHAVAPKLSAILDSWDPHSNKRDTVPLFIVVEPWSHIVREKVEDYVRRAIIRTGTCHALCSFKEMIDPKAWEDLAKRYVIPTLKMELQKIEFTRFSLQSDQFSQFEFVVSSASSLLPLNLMVRFLESNFFPNWLDVLYDWLDSGEADLDEVMIWYRSWRYLFTSDLIVHERMQQLLGVALQMMLDAGNGEPVEEPLFLHHYIPNPAPTDESWYERLTFKELIGEYAVDQDLLFVPKFGKFHDGLPVYTFGSVSICLHPIKKLLYAQIRQGGVTTWKSVSLTDLVAMNN